MKKTIEEVAKKYADKIWDSSDANEKTIHSNCISAFIAGAKYQSEQMYSEDELYKLLLDFIDFGQKQPHDMPRGIEIKNFINQLKKK